MMMVILFAVEIKQFLRRELKKESLLVFYLDDENVC